MKNDSWTMAILCLWKSTVTCSKFPSKTNSNFILCFTKWLNVFHGIHRSWANQAPERKLAVSFSEKMYWIYCLTDSPQTPDQVNFYECYSYKCYCDRKFITIIRIKNEMMLPFFEIVTLLLQPSSSDIILHLNFRCNSISLPMVV